MKFLNLAALVGAELLARRRDKMYRKIFEIALAIGALVGTTLLGLSGLACLLGGAFVWMRDTIGLAPSLWITGAIALLVSSGLALVARKILRTSF